jgi:carboxypeptidase C (cathepsin A)
MKVGLLLVISTVSGLNIFPGEDWDSGNVEIDKNNTSIFYYLFKARKPEGHKRVLIVWFNGGPGCAGFSAVLEEHGPYTFNNETLEFEYNAYSFNNHYDVLYLDQPVGTGFSNVYSEEHYCRNESCVAKNFYTFYIKFLTNFHPEYQNIPLYIMGESYAGHFVPAVMKYLLSMQNDSPNYGIKVAGGAIGNALIDITAQMVGNPIFVKEVTNVNAFQIFRFNYLVTICRLGRATDSTLFNDFCLHVSDEIYKKSGISYQYDIRIKKASDKVVKKVLEMINRKEIQEMFKVKGYRQFRYPCNSSIRKYLWDDWFDSYSQTLEYVLDKASIWLFYGDKDYICNWRGGEFLANSLNWNGKKEFNKAEYKDITLNGIVYGKYKKWKEFIFTRVHNAGHSVPAGQPFFAEHTLEAFIENGFKETT